MKNILTIVIIAFILVVAVLNAPAYLFSVRYWKAKASPAFGTVSVTQLASSDNLTDFPTFYNTNLNALNNGKVDISTTTIPAVTTLSNLATVGTIISGIWNGTAITATYGGTGSTTLALNHVLLGNGTGIMKTVSGLGTSGQLLTSGGAGTPPTWTSASFDTAINYTLTGLWTFSATTSQACSNLLGNACIFNSLSYKFPSAHEAGDLRNDGSGNLSWEMPTAYDSLAISTSATSTIVFSWDMFSKSGEGSYQVYPATTSVSLARSLLSITPGATLTNNVQFIIDSDGLVNFLNQHEFLGSLKFMAKFSATTSAEAQFVYGATSLIAHGKGFGVTVNGGTFACLADDGSASSTSAFSVGFDATKWTVYEVVKNSATSVSCKVNGQTAATVSTNVPTGASTEELTFRVRNNGSNPTVYLQGGYIVKTYSKF